MEFVLPNIPANAGILDSESWHCLAFFLYYQQLLSTMRYCQRSLTLVLLRYQYVNVSFNRIASAWELCFSPIRCLPTVSYVLCFFSQKLLPTWRRRSFTFNLTWGWIIDLGGFWTSSSTWASWAVPSMTRTRCQDIPQLLPFIHRPKRLAITTSIPRFHWSTCSLSMFQALNGAVKY